MPCALHNGLHFKCDSWSQSGNIVTPEYNISTSTVTGKHWQYMPIIKIT